MQAPTEYVVQLRDSSDGWQFKVQHYTPGIGIMNEHQHPLCDNFYANPGLALVSAQELVNEVVTSRNNPHKPCCVCLRAPVKDDHTASCAACEPVWRMIFSSGDEALRSIRTNSYTAAQLDLAIRCELRDRNRSTVLKALSSAIRKARR